MIIRGNYTAKCVRVVDGDTIVVEIGCESCGIIQRRYLRLARLDAPERIESFLGPWIAAKFALENLVESKEVVIQITQKWPEKYGRLVGEVFVNGTNVTNAMLATRTAKLWVK